MTPEKEERALGVTTHVQSETHSDASVQISEPCQPITSATEADAAHDRIVGIVLAEIRTILPDIVFLAAGLWLLLHGI